VNGFKTVRRIRAMMASRLLVAASTMVVVTYAGASHAGGITLAADRFAGLIEQAAGAHGENR
jgi:hypothetical protein